MNVVERTEKAITCLERICIVRTDAT